MTDLVCGEASTQCPNMYCWEAYKRRMATIRKLILRMCCKNRFSNMCQACGTAVVCPMSAYIVRPSQEQKEVWPKPNHARMPWYQGHM